MAKTYNVKAFTDVADICKKTVDEALKAANGALLKKDKEAYDKARVQLDTEVDAYNQALCNVEYVGFMSAPNPMIAAIKKFFIDVCKVREITNKDTGIVTGLELVTRKARVNLEKFCEFGELPTKWASDCSKLLALLALSVTDVYKMKPADLASKSYYFITQARRKMDGETPDSNTQIVRLLQEIIDETVPVLDKDGKNQYKCTNHDLAFIRDCVTKLDTKEKCTIATINERQFKNVMMSVFAHVLGEAYQVKTFKVKNA